MGKNRDYQSRNLTINRRAVIASASVTKQKNTIHSMSEVDISIPRRLIKEHYEKTGEKLSFTAYIVTCLAQTLKDYPDFNSFIKRKRQIILDNITISVLVEKETGGEKVPEPMGIKSAQKKNCLQIHKEIREAQKKAHESLGSFSNFPWLNLIPGFLLKLFIQIADKNINMARTYGKVAVTAVGMYSKEALWFIPHGSPTVLVTVGSFISRIIEEEGQFLSREHLCLTASFDHDIVDGAPASRFMEQFLLRIKSGTDL